MRLLTLALVTLGSPSFAQSQPEAQTFSLPAGCTAYLTVQSKECTVSHHFTCTNYSTGVQGRVDLDDIGATYIGTIDAETQWLNSFNPSTGSTETLEPGGAKPASFSELISTGSNDFDFSTRNDQTGLVHFVGNDTLTGTSVTIDGVTLEETTFHLTATAEDGTELWRTTGHEYISRDWRMFLSGTGETVTPAGSYKSDGSPVEFIFPGEPGFLSPNPKFGCGVVTSRADAPNLTLPAAYSAE
jgi:hypothetical protein